MKNLRLIFCLLFLSLSSIAQQGEPYNIQNISPELREGANVIIRKEAHFFEVQRRNRARLKVHKVMTVLNEEGAATVPFYLYYDPHRSITDLNATIYDAAGKRLKQLESEQFGDYAAVQNAKLFEQNRFKVFSYDTDNYPYTIAYNYTIEIEGLYRYPNWSPQKTQGVAIETADFHLLIPDSLNFRYKTYNLAETPDVIDTPPGKQYSWSVHDHQSVFLEPLGPEFYEITPNLQLFPTSFSYDGIAGSAENWESFGKWVYLQMEGRDKLPEATRQEVDVLLAQSSEVSQKIRKLYSYMHSKLRYLDLPVGIGTYQPLSAAQTDAAGYGDSKALANYMLALLRAAGIRSHYALVNSGKFATRIENDLPGAQFNHAVVAVPLASDTLWLDCSNPHRPPGYPGYFLSDRDVLLITEKGGNLVRTPAYEAKESVQARQATVLIGEKGAATAEVVTCFSGLQYEHISPVLLLAPEQQEEVIYRKTALSSFVIDGYNYYSRQNEHPVLEEKLVLSLDNFGKSSEEFFSFNPNLLNQMDGLPPLLSERQQLIEVKNAFLDIDTVTYILPQEMQVRKIPDEVKIISAFGKYEMQIRQEEDKIIYIRYLETNKGRFPASAYADMQEFYEDIVRADQRKVILQRQEDKNEKVELSRVGRLQNSSMLKLPALNQTNHQGDDEKYNKNIE